MGKWIAAAMLIAAVMAIRRHRHPRRLLIAILFWSASFTAIGEAVDKALTQVHSIITAAERLIGDVERLVEIVHRLADDRGDFNPPILTYPLPPRNARSRGNRCAAPDDEPDAVPAPA